MPKLVQACADLETLDHAVVPLGQCIRAVVRTVVRRRRENEGILSEFEPERLGVRLDALVELAQDEHRFGRLYAPDSRKWMCRIVVAPSPTHSCGAHR